MVELDSIDSKIIKQIEYYFGDVNISRDKFMKQIIQENDGWIPLETMLKFNRLKSISDSTEKIAEAVAKSTSGLLEVGPKGIRRNPDLHLPENFDEVLAEKKEHSVYVKGFDKEATLDEIMKWLETHGGKTLNVHMRRFPKDKQFKGSVFAVFEKKEDVNTFLQSEEAATYKGEPTIRMYRDDYWQRKKDETDSRLETRAKKQAEAEAQKNDQVASRMVAGALLELSGLPAANKYHSKDAKTDKVKVEGTDPNSNDAQADKSEETKTSDTESAVGENGRKVKPESPAPEEADKTDGDPEAHAPTVIAFKHWLIEKLGSGYSVAWIDIEPSEGKAIVRLKDVNSAHGALDQLQKAFGDKPVIYSGSELTGRALTGDEEKAHWRKVIDAQMNKAMKRRGRQNTRGMPNKRRRMN